MRTLKRSVRNVRSGTIQSQNFNSRAEIHFEDFQISVRDQNTLIHDSGVDDQDRIFIFSHPDLIAFCSGPCNLYMDGTFKVCPLLYNQIYSIHVEKNGIFSTCYGFYYCRPLSEYILFDIYIHLNNKASAFRCSTFSWQTEQEHCMIVCSSKLQNTFPMIAK